MKKFLFFSVLVFITAEVSAQAYDLSKYYPKYEGYRSLDYYQDTVRYLKYNWGLGAGGIYDDEQLAAFFEVFELPIYEVRLTFSKWDQPRLVALLLYLLPYEKLQIMRGQKQFDINRYVISVLIEFRHSGRPDRRPTYDELSPYFPGLNKEGKTLYPWKDSYKEILGKCWVESVQYSYEISGEPF